MTQRVSSESLVGREADLAALEGALELAAAGRGQLAFVAGESGVGKSRLMSEFAHRARAGGARILSGDCVELGDGELPYAAIISALRPLVRRGRSAGSRSGSGTTARWASTRSAPPHRPPCTADSSGCSCSWCARPWSWWPAS